MIQGGRGLRFALESGESLRIFCHLFGQELQGHKAVESSVLGLVDDTHPAAAEFLNDAIVRDGLADERVGGWHVQHILGRARNQVNEGGEEGQRVGQVPINAETGNWPSMSGNACRLNRSMQHHPLR